MPWGCRMAVNRSYRRLRPIFIRGYVPPIVTPPVTLGTLTLSKTRFIIGVADSGTINGASAGSVITGSGFPVGLTIDSAARTWSWDGIGDGTGTSHRSTLQLTETLANAIGSPKPNTIGYTVGNLGLSRWLDLVDAARAGTASGILACVGDSTTYGVGGTSYTQSYPYQLYLALVAAGLPAAYSGFTGHGQFSVTDARVVLAGGALTGTGFTNLCEGYVLTGAGQTMAVTPVGNVDTFDIYILKGGLTGTANVNLDGGATVTTLSTNGTSAVQKVTVSAALGAHTLNIIWTAGSVYPLFIDAYDSTAKKIRVLGFGFPAKKSADFISTGPYDPITVLNQLPPGLVIYDMGINDWENAVATSTYNTNISAFVTGVKTASDVLLVGPNHTGGSASDATQLTYDTELSNVASAQSLTFKDIHLISSNWTTYSAANIAGNMSDTLHPSAEGYQGIANCLAAVL